MAFQVLTLIAAFLGLLIFGILLIVFWATEGLTAMTCWVLTTTVFNVISVIFAFIRKKK